ncbi:MAG: CvpA family protein [Pseudomonadales bacterium]
MDQLLATTAADGSIVIILGISTVIGLFRGMVKEVLSLVIWVGAFIIARLLSTSLEPLLAGYIDSPYLRSATAFAAVFFTCLVAGGLVSRFVARLVKASGLVALDKVLGSVFGALRGAVVCIVVLLALRPFCDGYLWWGESFFIPLLMAFDDAVLSMIDGTVRLANEG